jgi:hypothetical protein
MFGETMSSQPQPPPGSCSGFSEALARLGVNGYKQSNLFSFDKQNVTMRVWSNSRDATCSPIPMILGAPNGPYGP